MKAFTDLEQSRKLAEILPIESSDQTWARIAIAGVNLDVPEELQYRHNGDMPFQYYSGIGLPCWSLAALLDVLPMIKKCEDIANPFIAKTPDGEYYIVYATLTKEVYDSSMYDNPVDACYEMIIKLHKEELL